MGWGKKLPTALDTQHIKWRVFKLQVGSLLLCKLPLVRRRAPMILLRISHPLPLAHHLLSFNWSTQKLTAWKLKRPLRIFYLPSVLNEWFTQSATNSTDSETTRRNLVYSRFIVSQRLIPHWQPEVRVLRSYRICRSPLSWWSNGFQTAPTWLQFRNNIHPWITHLVWDNFTGTRGLFKFHVQLEFRT